MSLTPEQVEEIAGLARLALTTEEKKRFGKQLSAILEYATMLDKLDTSGVPPTANVTGLEGVLREDRVEASLAQEEALANAPKQKDGFFVVPAVLDDNS